MLKGKMIVIVLLVMFSVSLWGCAGNIPEAQRSDYLNMNFGKSGESAKNNQILDPEAGKNLEPVVGLNGEAAEHGVDKYKKSFEKQAMERDVSTEASTFNIMKTGKGSSR